MPLGYTTAVILEPVNHRLDLRRSEIIEVRLADLALKIAGEVPVALQGLGRARPLRVLIEPELEVIGNSRIGADRNRARGLDRRGFGMGELL
jgi:hypothetical protein